MKNYLLIVSIAFLFQSCTKDEGYGGLASIYGKVYAKNFNSDGELVSEFILHQFKKK